MQRKVSMFRTTVFTLCSTLTFLSPLVAATRTWQGGGGNSLWSNGANWVGGIAPMPGDAVVFPSTAVDFTPDADIPNLGLTQMGLDGGTQPGGYDLISSNNTIVTLASGTIIDVTPTTSGFPQTISMQLGLLGPNNIRIQNNSGAGFVSLTIF